MDYITELGLADIVWDMFAQKEPITSIVQILKGQGHKVSYGQIVKFVENRMHEAGDPDRAQPEKAASPATHTVLDMITAASLHNACMKPNAKARMLAKVPEFKERFMKDWALRLNDNLDNPKELGKIAGDILLQCFKWTMAEIDWLKVQRSEREMALKATEAKLKYATELKAQTGARITIKPKEGGDADGRKILQFKVKKDV